MCTTEIWTYRECGCTLHHHVSCPPRKKSEGSNNTSDTSLSIDGKENDGLSPQPGTLAQGWKPMRSPRMTDAPVGLALSPALEMQCSVVHTVHKQFLDPVCDDCTVEEQKKKNRLSNIAILDDYSPIWSNEIVIEIDPRDYSFSSFSRPGSGRASAKSENASPCRPSSRKRRSRRFSLLQLRDRFVTPTPSITTCDDEEPERGRSRRTSPVRETRRIDHRVNDQTKEFRRRGVDLSRSDLRISSRWNSRERKSMEDFRETLKDRVTKQEYETPQESKPTATPTSQSKDLKGKIVNGIRRGLSRSRSRHRSQKRPDTSRNETLTPPPMPRSPFTNSNKSCDSLQIRGRQMPRSRSRSEYTVRTPRSSDDANVEIVADDNFKETYLPPKSSWDDSLQHDLASSPRQEKKRLEDTI